MYKISRYFLKKLYLTMFHWMESGAET